MASIVTVVNNASHTLGLAVAMNTFQDINAITGWHLLLSKLYMTTNRVLSRNKFLGGKM